MMHRNEECRASSSATRSVPRRGQCLATLAVMGTLAGLCSGLRSQTHVLWPMPASTSDGVLRRQAGDTNGDGYDDIVWRASGDAVILYSGVDMSVRHIWSKPTPYLGDVFGIESLGVGDVHGDGHCDVAIADSTYRPTSTIVEYGIVTIASGLTGAVLFTWVGVPYQELGRRVQGVGDLNGDGRGDVAIQSVQPGGNTTIVTVRSGADGTVLHTWTASDFYDHAFYDIVVAGDFDGDGVNDIGLAEATPALSPGVYGRGVVRIYSGATGASDVLDRDRSPRCIRPSFRLPWRPGWRRHTRLRHRGPGRVAWRRVRVRAAGSRSPERRGQTSSCGREPSSPKTSEETS